MAKQFSGLFGGPSQGDVRQLMRRENQARSRQAYTDVRGNIPAAVAARSRQNQMNAIGDMGHSVAGAMGLGDRRDPRLNEAVKRDADKAEIMEMIGKFQADDGKITPDEVKRGFAELLKRGYRDEAQKWLKMAGDMNTMTVNTAKAAAATKNATSNATNAVSNTLNSESNAVKASVVPQDANTRETLSNVAQQNANTNVEKLGVDKRRVKIKEDLIPSQKITANAKQLQAQSSSDMVGVARARVINDQKKIKNQTEQNAIEKSKVPALIMRAFAAKKQAEKPLTGSFKRSTGRIVSNWVDGKQVWKELYDITNQHTGEVENKETILDGKLTQQQYQTAATITALAGSKKEAEAKAVRKTEELKQKHRLEVINHKMGTDIEKDIKIREAGIRATTQTEFIRSANLASKRIPKLVELLELAKGFEGGGGQAALDTAARFFNVESLTKAQFRTRTQLYLVKNLKPIMGARPTDKDLEELKDALPNRFQTTESNVSMIRDMLKEARRIEKDGNYWAGGAFGADGEEIQPTMVGFFRLTQANKEAELQKIEEAKSAPAPAPAPAVSKATSWGDMS